MDRLEARALGLARKLLGPRGHAERMTKKLGVMDPQTGGVVEHVAVGRCLVGLMVPVEGLTEELRQVLHPRQDQKSVFVILGDGADFQESFLNLRDTLARDAAMGEFDPPAGEFPLDEGEDYVPPGDATDGATDDAPTAG
jgi:hypothetical protein